MTWCPVAFAWLVACCDGELSQQPMCPHIAHRRRCSHQPPAASHSAQPVPLGGTAGSMPSVIVMCCLQRWSLTERVADRFASCPAVDPGGHRRCGPLGPDGED